MIRDPKYWQAWHERLDAAMATLPYNARRTELWDASILALHIKWDGEFAPNSAALIQRDIRDAIARNRGVAA